ncbi:conserved hypothetical protein-putative secreted protein [hydrothermal vent metagenome]|uniref:Acetylxylan esterase n=1 Tax=hydrothermal vent metagenome TaxID=652676 RepID=A0A3B1E2G2_9ZZZZ
MFHHPKQIFSFAFFILFGSLVLNNVFAAPRLLPKEKTPEDSRLKPLKNLQGDHLFVAPQSKAEWKRRSEKLRRRLKVANGLWLPPSKTPLNAKVYGKISRSGFTVEKVHFESLPGHFVTGLLFRPATKSKTGKHPAILSPHGHWGGGRKYDSGKRKVLWAIVNGEERFEESGRTPIVARAVQLARMGCVVFAIDMLGYADSVQIPVEVSHRYGIDKKRRTEFETKKNWGFFSTQAELRQQNIMGLQTWNCIRGLDFLSSLKDVDSKRLGVTGCSGGGTQTILTCAIDPRPVVSFPQGMVSTSMQGGCVCENASLLRIGRGNVELAALFAPKPQAMTSANDWTKEMETKGFPELKQVYFLLGKKENVDMRKMTHFKHNYNYVTRAYMYDWMNRHLKLGLKTPIVEADFKRLSIEEQNVWDKEHPSPKSDKNHERKILKWITEQSNKQLAALTPKNATSFKEYQRVVGGAVDIIIGRGLPKATEISRKKVWKKDQGDYYEFGDLLRNTKQGEEFPVISFFPKKKPWNKHVIIWVDGEGKSGMYAKDGTPQKAIQNFIANGFAVIGADLFMQGEFLKDGKPIAQASVVNNPRPSASYTFGYNHTLCAKRVHDVLTLITFVHNYKRKPVKVHLVAVNNTVNNVGVIAAAARAQAGSAIDKAIINTQGFRFESLTTYRDVNFLSGIVKYGDLPALLALSAPQPLWLVGEQEKIPAVVEACYQATGKPKNIRSTRSLKQMSLWLLKSE